MRVAIFGLGYVGCTVACCIAKSGHQVTGIDVSEQKVADINAGRAPFSEPGIAELLKEGRAAGRIQALTAMSGDLGDTDLAIVCVGTPSGSDGSHDMSYIAEVTRQIAAAVRPNRARPLTVAYRSTMRPGSMETFVAPIFEAHLGADLSRTVELVYNPEFLRESVAVTDYFNPPKIVIGTRDGQPSEAMQALHRGITAQVFHTGFREAEFTKFVDNSWHAVKVGFANEIGRMCQSMGISASKVHEIFVSDTKLNISHYYMRPGGPFGGSCLPKDVRALQHIAHSAGANTHLVDSLLRTNEAHKDFQFDRIARTLPQGARVLLVGLAFKKDTDDLRESPNVDLARKLLEAGHLLSIFDPVLDPAKLRGKNLGYAYSHLPTIDRLLVDRATAEAGGWDLIVACNSTVDMLDLGEQNVVHTHTIP